MSCAMPARRILLLVLLVFASLTQAVDKKDNLGTGENCNVYQVLGTTFVPLYITPQSPRREIVQASNRRRLLVDEESAPDHAFDRAVPSGRTRDANQTRRHDRDPDGYRRVLRELRTSKRYAMTRAHIERASDEWIHEGLTASVGVRVQVHPGIVHRFTSHAAHPVPGATGRSMLQADDAPGAATDNTPVLYEAADANPSPTPHSGAKIGVAAGLGTLAVGASVAAAGLASVGAYGTVLGSMVALGPVGLAVAVVFAVAAFLTWFFWPEEEEPDETLGTLRTERAILNAAAMARETVGSIYQSTVQLQNAAASAVTQLAAMGQQVEQVNRMVTAAAETAKSLFDASVVYTQTLHRRVDDARLAIKTYDQQFTSVARQLGRRLESIRHTSKHSIAVARQKELIDMEMTGIPLRVKELRGLQFMGSVDTDPGCNEELGVPLPREMGRFQSVVFHSLAAVVGVPSQDGPTKYRVDGYACSVEYILELSDVFFAGGGASFVDYIIVHEKAVCWKFAFRDPPSVDSANGGTKPRLYNSRDSAYEMSYGLLTKTVDYFYEQDTASGDWVQTMLDWLFRDQIPVPATVEYANGVRRPVQQVPPGPVVRVYGALIPARTFPGQGASTAASSRLVYSSRHKQDTGLSDDPELLRTTPVKDAHFDIMLYYKTLVVFMGFQPPVLNEAARQLVESDRRVMNACYGPLVPAVVLGTEDGLYYEYSKEVLETRFSLIPARHAVHAYLSGVPTTGWHPLGIEAHYGYIPPDRTVTHEWRCRTNEPGVFDNRCQNPTQGDVLVVCGSVVAQTVPLAVPSRPQAAFSQVDGNVRPLAVVGNSSDGSLVMGVALAGARWYEGQPQKLDAIRRTVVDWGSADPASPEAIAARNGFMGRLDDSMRAFNKNTSDAVSSFTEARSKAMDASATAWSAIDASAKLSAVARGQLNLTNDLIDDAAKALQDSRDQIAAARAAQTATCDFLLPDVTSSVQCMIVDIQNHGTSPKALTRVVLNASIALAVCILVLRVLFVVFGLVYTRSVSCGGRRTNAVCLFLLRLARVFALAGCVACVWALYAMVYGQSLCVGHSDVIDMPYPNQTLPWFVRIEAVPWIWYTGPVLLTVIVVIYFLRFFVPKLCRMCKCKQISGRRQGLIKKSASTDKCARTWYVFALGVAAILIAVFVRLDRFYLIECAFIEYKWIIVGTCSSVFLIGAGLTCLDR